VTVFNLEIAFIHVEFDIRVLDKLKEFDWKAYHVLYAILFGSIAKRGKGRDIDIAVEFEEYNIDLYLKLLNDLQEYLNTEFVDLVLTSPTLKSEGSHGLSGFYHPSFREQSRGSETPPIKVKNGNIITMLSKPQLMHLSIL